MEWVSLCTVNDFNLVCLTQNVGTDCSVAFTYIGMFASSFSTISLNNLLISQNNEFRCNLYVDTFVEDSILVSVFYFFWQHVAAELRFLLVRVKQIPQLFHIVF